jgi:hypothetical protein
MHLAPFEKSISAKFKLLMRNTVKINTDNLSFQLWLPGSRKRIQAESRLVRRILVAVGGIRVVKNSCETPDYQHMATTGTDILVDLRDGCENV